MHKPVKVSFFGHFGSPNSGNESTLLAILSRLRSLLPESEFHCICTYPEALVATDGIEATSITTRVARIWDRDAPWPNGCRWLSSEWARSFGSTSVRSGSSREPTC